MTQETIQSKDQKLIFSVGQREMWAVNLIHNNGGIIPLYSSCSDEPHSLRFELARELRTPSRKWVYRYAARLAYQLESKGIVRVEYRKCPFHKHSRKKYIILVDQLKDYCTHKNVILPFPLFS